MYVLRTLSIAVLLFCSLFTQAQTGSAWFQSSFSTEPGPAFSADFVDETIQTLSDGNHIRQQVQGKLYRNSQGKVRNDHTMKTGDLETTFVTIFDPVARTFINFQLGAGTPATANASYVNLPEAVGKTRTPRKMLPFGSESLPDKMIEGFVVSGSRNTRTIKAGEVGNELPITIVHEQWHSQQLGEDLLTESDDPRIGHRTHKLFNIKLEEPDPALFEIPAGYKAEEQPGAPGLAQQAK